MHIIDSIGDIYYEYITHIYIVRLQLTLSCWGS